MKLIDDCTDLLTLAPDDEAAVRRALRATARVQEERSLPVRPLERLLRAALNSAHRAMKREIAAHASQAPDRLPATLARVQAMDLVSRVQRTLQTGYEAAR